jgi:uncharacterized protein YbaA (DUF1428 family)
LFFHTNFGSLISQAEMALPAIHTQEIPDMTYFTGAVAPVPTVNRKTYADHVAAAWPMFKTFGAVHMVDTWGADVPRGKVTDFYGAVDARDDESIVFSWIEWPDKETADAAWQTMQGDPAPKELPEMPFDGRRMIFGGFAPVYSAGRRSSAGYYQGFLLAVRASCSPCRKRTRRLMPGWRMKAGKFSKNPAPSAW